jgi:hypothetical protein
MSWRGGALALACVALDLAAASCAGSRRWATDEADRIDAVMGVRAFVDGGEPLPPERESVVMGPAPPLAEPTGPRQQLSLNTPWSEPSRTRRPRWYLGRLRRAPAVGRDATGLR